ncbi:MAG: 3-dehydroquinate synthase [Candidatus Xenobiia bacterium LiM19]
MPDFSITFHEKEYHSEYIVEHRICSRVGNLLRQKGLGSPIFVVTNPLVKSLHGSSVMESLEKSGYSAHLTEIPDGEQFKTLEWAACLYDKMIEAGLDRNSTVLALGGGVICDLAGFAAATFLRGIRHVLLPTTLLAQIDASIGGKVGVDHQEGKNLIGAFYQPVMTLCDPDVLLTLDARQWACGMAEVIKTALIEQSGLFEILEDQGPLTAGSDNALLLDVIMRTARIKASIVSEDPHEKGKRAFLNLGHTLGHALETASGYRIYLHGEAVSIGLSGACILSEEMGWLTSDFTERVRRLLSLHNLPTLCGDIDMEKVKKALRTDKKRDRGLRFVLLRGTGSPEITSSVTEDMIEKVLLKLQKKQ